MNTLLLITFALSALFRLYLSKIFEFIKLLQWSSAIPGPTIAELLENVKKGRILEWMKELRKQHGPTFCIWMGKDLMVLFTDPEDVKQVLSNNTLLYKSSSYNISKPWMGNGLLTSGGEFWHARRKMLTPAFHIRILSEFKEPIEENCKILVHKLGEKANGEQFDMYPYITLFALDAICETAMGFKKNAQMQSESEYVKAVENICRIISTRSYSFWQRNNIFFEYTQAGREMNSTLKVLHEESNRAIQQRRKLLKDSNIQNFNDAEKSLDDLESKRRLAFLDMLLISQLEGIPLTDQEIREEVDTFMFGGHDTISSAMGFVVYLLSQHVEVQKRAYEEAVLLAGREKESMPYLEAIIKETLRLYPPGPQYSRNVKEKMKVGNLTLPKGSNIVIMPYLIHRNEKEFPEPEKFDPERFLHKENNIHPFSFVAFSAGPRNCIGQKFAMLEMKCTLSSLLRNFEFLPVKDFIPNIRFELVLKSGNGIQIRMKKRT